MSKTSSKSAFELLHDSSGPVHAAVLQKARYLRDLETKIAPLIPAPLNEHCRVANVRDGILVLQTDSPIWTTKAKFITSDLLHELNRMGLNFQQVRVKTRPREESYAVAHHKPDLSSSAAGLLEDLADSVTIPQLADALRRLASHKKR